MEYLHTQLSDESSVNLISRIYMRYIPQGFLLKRNLPVKIHTIIVSMHVRCDKGAGYCSCTHLEFPYPFHGQFAIIVQFSRLFKL